MGQNPEYAQPLVYGIAALIGLLSCFAGYRLFKLILIGLLAVAGAAGLAWVGFAYGEQPLVWSLGGLVLGAVLGAILAVFSYTIAVGLVASLFVSLSMLPWLQDFAVMNQVYIIGVASMAAALIAIFLTTIMIQVATAMLGGVLIVHSALYFATGQTVHRIVEKDGSWSLDLNLDHRVAGAALVIGLIGFLVQSRRRFGSSRKK